MMKDKDIKNKDIKDKDINQSPDISILFPTEKDLSFTYKNLQVTFHYSEPTIETELQIAAKRKALAKAFGIPLSELNKENSEFSDEIILINILSRLYSTVSDIKVNGEPLPKEKLAEIKDVDFLFEFFRTITEATNSEN